MWRHEWCIYRGILYNIVVLEGRLRDSVLLGFLIEQVVFQFIELGVKLGVSMAVLGILVSEHSQPVEHVYV